MATRKRQELPSQAEMAEMLEQLQKMQKPKTEAQKVRDSILESLAELGGQQMVEDAIVRQGTRLVLPETMQVPDAISFLQEYTRQQDTVTQFSKTFRYRPYDGAAALERALKRVFGSAGIGKTVWSFFGRQPPQRVSVHVDVERTIDVPWGHVEVPSFDGVMMIGTSMHREYGPLFSLSVEAPRKYKPHIEGLFVVIEQELRDGSIYKGKAVDGQSEPEFLDLAGVEPTQVIYSEDVMVQLEANIWSVLRHTAALRAHGIPRKRAVLLEGPYGTGKTLAAFLTAIVATSNGWTFIYCRPGKDDLGQVMGMARLYQPSVVFFEDVDTVAAENDPHVVTRLLDMFDGITAKGTEIMAVLTTNHKERIHRAMVRPGRLDAMVHIGALDRTGVERMITALVDPALLGDLDYDVVHEAMEGFLPAFVKEAVDRTMRYAISRGEGTPERLETLDFVAAAHGLRPQLELMQDAGEGTTPESLALALRREVRLASDQALKDRPIFDLDGDVALTVGGENGGS